MSPEQVRARYERLCKLEDQLLAEWGLAPTSRLGCNLLNNAEEALRLATTELLRIDNPDREALPRRTAWPIRPKD